jgi:hypothetical protein
MQGMAVFVVDVPAGHAGESGAAFAARVARVQAALASIEARPEVAADARILFLCCAASHVGYELLARNPGWFRGVVDLNGTVGPWVPEALARAGRAPPVHWIILQGDPAAVARRAQAAALGRESFPVTSVEYATNHDYQDAGARAQLLRDVAAFVRSHTGYDCGRQSGAGPSR